MSGRGRRKAIRILLRLAATIISVSGAYLLHTHMMRAFGIALPPYITYCPAVMIVSLQFGFWYGLFATLMSIELANQIFPLWTSQPGSIGVSEHVTVLLFLTIGIFMAVVGGRYRMNLSRIRAFGKAATLKEEALREAKSKLEAALASMSDAVTIFDTEGRFIDVNDAFARFFRFKNRDEGPKSRDGFPPMDFFTMEGKLIPAEMWPGAQALRGEKGINVEYRLWRKDIDVSWIGSHNFSPILDKESKIVGAVVVARDITERKQADNAMRASEERYRSAFQTSLDGISITRLRDGQYIDVNQTYCEITGFQRDQIIGHTSLELGFWVERSDRSALIDRLRSEGQCRDVQTQMRRKNGEVFWSQASATLFELDGETCMMYVMRDISAAKSAEEEIRNLAFFDPLTGLANRRYLTEQVQKGARTAEGALRERAMLFVDLDDFKSLNDALGHQAGDLILREVAHRLEICVRKSDTVGRLGGDEFVVILEDLDPNPKDAAAQAQAVAEKILAELGRPYRIGGRESNGSCSIGIAVFDGAADKVNEIMQQAEIAMYQAKAAGRGNMRFFAPELQIAVSARAELESDLREGIKARQFLLYFQPQVEGGRIIGAEALVRWKHPSRGVLAPGDFIALAEETGLILPLGELVLDIACSQIAQWAGSSRTSGINMSVNISALQLAEADFVDSVLTVLDRTGANPRNLKLELTESMLVNNIDVVIDKMTRLKSYGLSFSVDDFGTGYSSLAYLKRLPLDQLKIDRAFVRDILVDLSSRAIARAIVNLSQAMGISAMAEGVETQEQLDLLIGMGCHAYQGFFFSRPVPIEDFEKLLNRETAEG